MPVGLGNIMSMRPPFGGLRSTLPTRALAQTEAHSMLNVWTPDGDIQTRPPVAAVQTDFGFPVGRTSALMLKCFPVWGQTVGQFYNFAAYILDNRLQYGIIIDPVSGAVITDHTFTATPPTAGRFGVALFDEMLFFMSDFATDSIKFYDAGSGWTKARIGAASGSAPGTSLQAGGSLTVGTTYSYVYTYYNSATGTESAPSGAGSHTPTAGNQIIRLTFSASSDTQIDKVRIYRQEVGVDDTWYFLAQVNDGSSPYDDGGAVTPSKTVDQRVILFGFEITQRVHSIAYYKRRMWYAPEDIPGGVIHSEVDRPEQINPLNSYVTITDRSNPVIAMVATDEALYILRFNSIDILTGDSQESFAISVLAKGVGCASAASVVTVGKRIFFSSLYGVHEIFNNQVSEVPLTEPVQDVFMACTAPGLIVAAADVRVGIVAFSYPTSSVDTGTPPIPSTSTTYKQLVYDYYRNKWYHWDLQARGLGTSIRNPHTLYPPDFVMEINKSGASNRYKLARTLLSTDAQDFGTDSISWSWETGDFDLGIPYYKSIYYATLGWQKSTDTANITLEWFKNQATSATASDTFASNSDPPLGKTRIGRHVDTIRFKLSGSAAKILRIASLDFEVEPRGAR